MKKHNAVKMYLCVCTSFLGAEVPLPMAKSYDLTFMRATLAKHCQENKTRIYIYIFIYIYIYIYNYIDDVNKFLLTILQVVQWK